jgi:hypothetical protein
MKLAEMQQQRKHFRQHRGADLGPPSSLVNPPWPVNQGNRLKNPFGPTG